jgi:hypothetical protein
MRRMERRVDEDEREVEKEKDWEHERGVGHLNFKVCTKIKNDWERMITIGSKHILDGEGAKIFGGKWGSKIMPCVEI